MIKRKPKLVANRLVRVDRDLVQSMAQELTQVVLEDLKKFGDQHVDDVVLAELMFSQLGDLVVIVAASDQGNVAGCYQGDPPTVEVYLPPAAADSYQPLGIYQTIERVLLHELTHHHDPGSLMSGERLRSEQRRKGKSHQRYLSSSHERQAFSQTIAEDTMRSLRVHRRLVKLGRREPFERQGDALLAAMRSSEEFLEYERQASPEAVDRMIRDVYLYAVERGLME